MHLIALSIITLACAGCSVTGDILGAASPMAVVIPAVGHLLCRIKAA